MRRSTARLGVDFVKRRYSEWPLDCHGKLPKKFREAGMEVAVTLLSKDIFAENHIYRGNFT